METASEKASPLTGIPVVFIIFVALVWFLMIAFWGAGMPLLTVLAFASEPAAILLIAALFGAPDRFKTARSD